MRKHFFKKDKHVNLFLKWSTISCQNVFLNDSLLGDLNFRIKGTRSFIDPLVHEYARYKAKNKE